ncbi:hypothetical protein [Nonomuraea sp. CA-141351]|uniref:hypothetical protein n=1 Tax=Nonomuraea sp. CA-141351 TaxID=3239996 RepID=UPI003D90820F
MSHVRTPVLEARRDGMPVRRTAELSVVSPDTVNEWVQAARAEALAQLRRNLDQAPTPPAEGCIWGSVSPNGGPVLMTSAASSTCSATGLPTGDAS